MENVDKGLTTKIGTDSLAENNPKCPKIYLPNLSVQAQKFGISMKKRLHWVSVVRVQSDLEN
jgi:hypothetical protein